MGEMAAMVQIHCEVGIAGLHHREIHGHVRLGARVRLDVRVVRSEKLLRAFDG